MHPNLSAAVIELRLLAILAGIMVYFFFFHTDSNSPLCNGMDGIVTIVIEVDQKKILEQGQQSRPRENQLS